MLNLKKKLQKRLDKAARILFLGVGSELRGDDAAGMILAQNLKTRLRGRTDRRIRVLLGGTAPENLTGPIKRFRPSHLVILDAADLGKRPGEAVLIELGNVNDATFGTHVLSMDILVKYIRETVPLEAFLLGIQPLSLDFGRPLTPRVASSVGKLAAMLAEIL